MRKPDVIEKSPTNMSSLKSELEKIQERDEELSFRGNRTMEYLQEFVDLDADDAEKLIEELRGLDIARLKEEFIMKIVDGTPTTMDELKVLLQGYTLSLDQDDMKKVLDVVKKHV